MIYDFVLITKIIFIGFISYLFKITDYNITIINILKQLSDLNITFAKIFQWSFIDEKNRNIYITNEIYEYVYNYTNNTPYTNSDIDYEKILQTNILANNLGDKFELTDTIPIGSGTISLVFKGKLNNNPVAIKLLRKNIDEQLKKGIDLLVIIGYILSKIPYINLLMFDKIIEKNKKNFMNQKNFQNEVSNIKLFYNKLKKNKFVKVPNVYPIYTNNIDRIIIMDYIDGRKIDQLTIEEKQNFIIPFIKFIKNSIFSANILHTDLHQGNILFIEEKCGDKIIYKVGIIDLGMVVTLGIVDCNFCYYFIDSIFNNKFMNFIEYLFDDDNYAEIFEKISMEQIIRLRKIFKDEYELNGLFKIIEIKNIISDTYFFLKIIKNNNCEFSHNIHKILLGLLPIFSVIVGLGNDSKNNILVQKEFSKMNNNNLLNDI